jgi:hypothetical protein
MIHNMEKYLKNEREKIFLSLQENMCDIPPENPSSGALYMDTKANIFVYLDDVWRYVEEVEIREPENLQEIDELSRFISQSVNL